MFFERDVPRKFLMGQVAWFVLWLIATGIGAFMLNPSEAGHGTHRQLGLPPCGSVVMFDRPCPGCGMTTSWTHFIHGDFTQSFQPHPLGPIVYMLFTLTAFMCLYGYARGYRLITESKLATRSLVAAIVIFSAFGVGRFFMVKMNSQEHLVWQQTKEALEKSATSR